jgi:hypothetical protein
MSGEIEVVNRIDVVIEGMTADLERYVKKGNANQFVVDKNNGYIERLVDVRNFIAMLANSVDFHIVMGLLSEITNLERKDPELTGHLIKLCKRKGNRFSLITKCY